jgi:hypothetical protein
VIIVSEIFSIFLENSLVQIIAGIAKYIAQALFLLDYLLGDQNYGSFCFIMLPIHVSHVSLGRIIYSFDINLCIYLEIF